MEITFGIPNQRTRVVKEDKYPNKAVITMLPRPEERGSYKFVLNKLAQDALRLTLDGQERVAFGFHDGRVFIANVTNESTFDTGYRVAKQGSFSNGKVYDYLATYLRLDTTIENEFEIIEVIDVSNALELHPIQETQTHLTVEHEVEEGTLSIN